MLTRPRISALAGGLVALCSVTGPALADDAGLTLGGSTVCGPVSCDLSAASHGTAAGKGQESATNGVKPGAGGGSSKPVCSAVVSSEVVTLPSDERGQWYLLDCGRGFYEGGAGPGVPSDVPLWAGFGPGADPVKAVDPKVLAEKAVSSLELPKPAVRLSPGAAGPQVVRVPTWLWVEPGQWKPVRATAEVPGVSVVAVASPASVTWGMGDGATVECKGAGTPYSAEFDAAMPSPDCGHTYLRTSAAHPEGAFVVSVTVHWSVSWSGAGQSGTYPDLATTSELAVRVVEVQSLVTR